MNRTGGAILTIGHSNHALEKFIELLRRHRVNALADVRSAPYSRFNPQFNREPLAASLKAEGIAYVYLGRELGGRPGDRGCYDNEGRVLYDRVAATETFRSGLERVVDGAARFRIALMCAEKEPLHCHRTLLVAHELDRHGVGVAHIHADGRMESHAEAMDRLIELTGLRPDGGLFRRAQTRAELIAEAMGRQARRAADVARGPAAGFDETDR